MSDLISREAAIAYAISGRTREFEGEKWIRVSEVRESIQTMISAPPAQQWIPIKYRKITEDEVAIFYEMEFKFGFIGADEVVFECTMPEYVQEIFISTDDGRVDNDVCLIRDNVYYLEERIDFYGVVAWMPLDRPEPYKGETNE